MKRHFILILAVLLLSVYGCEKKWQHYYSQTGKFSIDTPEAVMESVKFADMAIGPVTVNTISYSPTREKIAYAINFYELSDAIIKLNKDEVLALAGKGFIDFSGKDSKVTSKKTITTNGIEGMELYVESGKGSRFVLGRIYYADDKVYYVVVEKLGSKTLTEDDKKFLDSFTFHFKNN